MRRHRLVAFGALAVAACLSACASLFGFEELTFSPDASTPPDAPTSPEPDGSTVPTTCETSKRPPSRPDSGPGEDSLELTFAIDRFDVGIRPDGGGLAAPNGFDLDETCTDEPSQSSCVTRASPGQFADYVKDKAGGVDNAAFVLLQLLGDSLGKDAPFTPDQINGGLRRGRFGFLLDVKGYNGEANDQNVRVSFRPSLGTTDAGAPRFDGNDEWALDTEFANTEDFLGGKFIDVTAYVRDSVLYTAFPELVLPIQRSANGNVLRIVLRDVLVSARIDKVGSKLALSQGVVAGKWPVEDAFAGIRKVAYGSDEVSTLCSQPEYDTQFRQRACGALDIRQGLGRDAAAPCDALSVGFGFAASQTKAAVKVETRVYRDVTCPRVDCTSPLDAGFISEEAGTFDATPPP